MRGCPRRTPSRSAGRSISPAASPFTTSARPARWTRSARPRATPRSKITVYGRDTTGAIQNYTATLNGQSWVTGSQSFERLLYAALTGASANGPVADPGGTPATGDVCLGSHNCVVPSGAVTTDVTIHTAQTGSAQHSGVTPALFKLQAGDGASVAAGQIIWTKGGTGPNQLRQIIAVSGYGTDVVAVNRDWGTLPDNTTTYKVVEGMLFEILPNAVTAIVRAFSTAAADVPSGSQRVFYEKVFAVNNNTATALTGAQIEIASETPSLPAGALLDIALCTALNDTNTTTNRQTAPASGAGSFVTQPALVNVPGAGNLTPGAAPNSAGCDGDLDAADAARRDRGVQRLGRSSRAGNDDVKCARSVSRC